MLSVGGWFGWNASPNKGLRNRGYLFSWFGGQPCVAALLAPTDFDAIPSGAAGRR